MCQQASALFLQNALAVSLSDENIRELISKVALRFWRRRHAQIGPRAHAPTGEGVSRNPPECGRNRRSGGFHAKTKKLPESGAGGGMGR